jgi:hypothetical protein
MAVRLGCAACSGGMYGVADGLSGMPISMMVFSTYHLMFSSFVTLYFPGFSPAPFLTILIGLADSRRHIANVTAVPHSAWTTQTRRNMSTSTEPPPPPNRTLSVAPTYAFNAHRQPHPSSCQNTTTAYTSET